jgi:hypothetical protein
MAFTLVPSYTPGIAEMFLESVGLVCRVAIFLGAGRKQNRRQEYDHNHGNDEEWGSY